MRYISFSYLTPALLAGVKTVTRRDWKESFAKGFHQGDLVTAYDKNPRFGGKPVATIRLTADPYIENSMHVPNSDWVHEGFDWLADHDQGEKPWQIWKDWMLNARLLWVIRFELWNNSTSPQ